jgi:hypothetical protein
MYAPKSPPRAVKRPLEVRQYLHSTKIYLGTYPVFSSRLPPRRRCKQSFCRKSSATFRQSLHAQSNLPKNVARLWDTTHPMYPAGIPATAPSPGPLPRLSHQRQPLRPRQAGQSDHHPRENNLAVPLQPGGTRRPGNVLCAERMRMWPVTAVLMVSKLPNQSRSSNSSSTRRKRKTKTSCLYLPAKSGCKSRHLRVKSRWNPE